MKYLILKSFFLIGLLTIFAWAPSVNETPINTMQKPTKYTVKISHMKFVPATLKVKKGDTVVWENKDFFAHDVTDALKSAWSSGPLNAHESWSKVITKDENYICNLHKVMKGSIKVE